MSSLEPEEIAALRPDALAPAQIAAKAVTVGKGKATMPAAQAFVSAILAGIFIGLGASFMLVVKADTKLGFAASSVLGGFVFSLGLYLVVTAGAELFTGNNLMVIGALQKEYSPAQMLSRWVLVYLGNLVGSLILVALMAGADFAGLGSGAVGEAMVRVAQGKATLAFGTAFFRGVLCNMLVCLAVWCSFATRTVVDKLFSVVTPVMAFVACGFEHCVANMFFLPMGAVAAAAGYGEGGVALQGIAANLCASTLGNIVGGALLVGVVYWFVYLKKHEA
ncbi:MAG: formate/nitrite transporter family protein [Atopobiaceae bacterium]|nr:formate/nitrite transporter family protein [Atopobiaceae bacterium]